MPMIIAVCPGNGDLQYLVASNLAAALVLHTELPTVLMDCSGADPSLLSAVLNNEPRKTIGDLCAFSGIADRHLMKGYLQRNPDLGFSVLGAATAGAAALDRAECRQAIRSCAAAFTYAVMILPAAAACAAFPLMDDINYCVLPVSPHVLSVRAAQCVLRALAAAHLPLSAVNGVIISNRDAIGLQSTAITDALGIPCGGVVRFEEETAYASLNAGRPFVISHPLSLMTQDMLQYTAAIVQLTATESRAAQRAAEGSSAAVRAPAGAYLALKERLHRAIIDRLAPELQATGSGQLRERIGAKARALIEEVLAREADMLSSAEKVSLLEELLDEALGLGPLEPLLRDSSITEIMVNGPRQLYVERAGKIAAIPGSFTSSARLSTIIDRIVAPLGRRIDEASPVVDARLADGSRVNIVIPPIALNGPVISIRKFPATALTVADLEERGSLTAAMAAFLEVCVRLRKNIVISGGTGSGKTTLLNILAGFIPPEERIVTIEDAAELRLPQDHVVRLESRPASTEGTGAIPIRRLVVNALRMRPDRIVVGECRSGEALDMLQAMNTGHDGSLTTIHANTPRDAVTRIVMMALMAGTEISEPAVREQIRGAVHVVVQVSRLADGSRKITEISELAMADGMLAPVPLFVFVQSGLLAGRVQGKFTATGRLPSFAEDIEKHGLFFDRTLFQPVGGRS